MSDEPNNNEPVTIDGVVRRPNASQDPPAIGDIVRRGGKRYRVLRISTPAHSAHWELDLGNPNK